MGACLMTCKACARGEYIDYSLSGIDSFRDMDRVTASVLRDRLIIPANIE